MNPTLTPPTGWQRFKAGSVNLFHAYASWLVSISWLKFIVLSVLLLMIAGILSSVPPFSWTTSERVETVPRRVVIKTPPKPPTPPGTASR